MLTIRDFLDHFIGLRVVDITSHDPGVDDPSTSHVTLMFNDGSWLRIPFGEDDELSWNTINQCIDHVGCISGEFHPPDPGAVLS